MTVQLRQLEEKIFKIDETKGIQKDDLYDFGARVDGQYEEISTLKSIVDSLQKNIETSKIMTMEGGRIQEDTYQSEGLIEKQVKDIFEKV